MTDALVTQQAALANDVPDVPHSVTATANSAAAAVRTEETPALRLVPRHGAAPGDLGDQGCAGGHSVFQNTTDGFKRSRTELTVSNTPEQNWLFQMLQNTTDCLTQLTISNAPEQKWLFNRTDGFKRHPDCYEDTTSGLQRLIK